MEPWSPSLSSKTQCPKILKSSKVFKVKKNQCLHDSFPSLLPSCFDRGDTQRLWGLLGLLETGRLTSPKTYQVHSSSRASHSLCEWGKLGWQVVAKTFSVHYLGEKHQKTVAWKRTHKNQRPEALLQSSEASRASTFAPLHGASEEWRQLRQLGVHRLKSCRTARDWTLTTWEQSYSKFYLIYKAKSNKMNSKESKEQEITVNSVLCVYSGFWLSPPCTCLGECSGASSQSRPSHEAKSISLCDSRWQPSAIASWLQYLELCWHVLITFVCQLNDTATNMLTSNCKEQD